MFIPVSQSVTARLDGLRELFQDCQDTLFLRGSFARGDSYCNDIDISAYNKTGVIELTNPPTEYNGLKINYGGISLENFEAYFSVCPRAGSSMMEMQPIVLGHSEVAVTYADQLKQYFKNRTPNYLLFLLVEEETNGRIADRSCGDDYFTLKRQRGGKRTVSRIIWGTKARHFDSFYSLSHSEVLEKMVAHGALPWNVAKSCTFILNNSHQLQHKDKLKAHSAQIVRWYYDYYYPVVKSYLLDYLPSDVVVYSIKAARSDTKVADLYHAYELSKSLDGQLKWILLFALSGNWKLPPSLLVEIWHEFRNNTAHRNIIRNLIANVSTPRDLINPAEFIDNKLMWRAYTIRLRLLKEFQA